MDGRATLRAATPADAELIHALTMRAWRGTVAPDSSAFRETTPTLTALFAAGGGAFVLLVDGEPSGSVRHVPVAHAVPTWEIKRMGVLPALRGAGHGDRLVGAVIAAARAAGVRRLQLGVRADQPRLLAYWRSLGFEADASVTLSSRNPLVAPPVTMSRRIDTMGDGAASAHTDGPATHRAAAARAPDRR